jgi:hypothetical protein
MRFRAPSVFEAAPGSCRVDPPSWRKTERTMPTPLRVPRGFQPAPIPDRLVFHYWRMVEVSISTRSCAPRVFKARCRAAG